VQNTQQVSNDSALGQLTRLQTLWRRCRYPADSTYAYLLHLLGRRTWDKAKITLQPTDFQTAAAFTRAAIRVNEGRGPATSEANLSNSYNNLGILYASHLNRTKEALPLLLKAFKIASQYPHKQNVAVRAALHTAYWYKKAGDFQQAIVWATTAYTQAQKSRDSDGLFWSLREQAEVFVAWGRYSEAWQALNRQIALAKASAQPDELSKAYLSMASLLRQQGRYAAMKTYFRRALTACRHDPDGAALVYTNLGYSLTEYVHDYPQAERCLTEGLRLVRDSVAKARLLDNLGYCFLLQKKFPQALAQYQGALQALVPAFRAATDGANPPSEAVRSSPNRDFLLDIVRLKADVWLAWANATHNPAYFKNALATYATADQMVDYMRWEHTGEGSKKFWREKTHRLYENALETCYRLKDPEQAFYFFEKSRAALLADRLNELGASQLLKPTDQRREAAIQTSLNHLRQQLSGLSFTDKSYTKFQRELQSQEADQKAFIDSLATRNSAYHNYRYDTSAVTLPQVREKLLTGGQTLLEYFVGDSAGYALTVTATGANLTRFNASTYAKTTRQLLAQSADAEALNRQFPRFLAASHFFFREFFGNLNIPKGRVIVSPDGAIVPLDLLSRSATRTEWLLSDYAFVYAYSARVLVKQPQRTSATARSFLGLAPVAFAGGLPPLGGSDASLNTVADGYFSPTLLVGSAATKRAFLREIPRHRVVQLYAHAQADSTGAEPLIFFADSALKASDFSTTGLLPTQLVVLSACQTGVGQATRGEGVFSLARGLAGAGVPATVTTLWRVDNAATYRLTELFFKKLKEGLPKDEALQRAKLEFLKTAPGTQQLPSFWAGMVLIGDAAPLESGVPLWAWAGGGLAVLGLGGWLFRKRTGRTANKK
jgi:CHAT domain-containing protein